MNSSRTFSVFNELKSKKELKVAVLKEDKKIINFLNRNKISYVKFDKEISKNIPVLIFDNKLIDKSSKDGNIIAESSSNNSIFNRTVKEINEFVSIGGNAIYINTPARIIRRTGENLTFQIEGEKVLPMDPVKNISQGLWDGILHINKKHPIFKGLPVNIPLTDLYENIGPTVSFRDLKGENIVQTIAFDRIPNGNIMKRNYIGSGDVWSGSDLSIVDYNNGKMLLSTLKLYENIGLDPVADKILFNIINYFN